MDGNPEQEPVPELPPDDQGAPEERAAAPIAEAAVAALPPGAGPPSFGEVPGLG